MPRPSEPDAASSSASEAAGVRHRGYRGSAPAMELGSPRLRRCRVCERHTYVGDGVCIQVDCWRNDTFEVRATVLRWLLWQACSFLRRGPGLLWHPAIEVLVFTLAGVVRDQGGEHLLLPPPPPPVAPDPRPPPPP